jgi:hypothetical protein
MYTITIYDDMRMKHIVATKEVDTFDELLDVIKKQLGNGLHCKFVDNKNQIYTGVAYARMCK